MNKRHRIRLLLVGVVAAIMASSLAPISASSANISHSYQAATSIQNGSLVSLDPQRSDYVEPADIDNGPRLLGVAVASNDSLLAVDAGSGRVQVATNGDASVLVSNVNGDVDVGDQIAVSPFAGIGMKPLPGSRVIGLAQTAFKGASPDAVSRQVKDKKGRASTIKVGYVRVTIAIGTSSLDANLNTLQKTVRNMTGRTVSTIRIIFSMVVAFIAIMALVTLIYASIYASIIAVGRNPLARDAIFRTLLKVIGLTLLIAALAGATIFLLLK